MDKLLAHYRVIAERDTGFWLTLPVPTGQTVQRETWLQMNKDDPSHFQILELAPDSELSLQSATEGEVVERALSVYWADEFLH